LTVRPADEDVEAVREALYGIGNNYEDSRTHLFVVSYLNEAHAALDSLSARLDAAVEGQAAAEQRAADAEKALDALYRIAINGQVCTPPYTWDDPMFGGDGSGSMFDVEAMKCPECKAAWRSVVAYFAAARAGEATEQPVNRVLVDAADETGLRAIGAPVRCCGEWPECSHMLAWYETHRAGEATERDTSYACHPTHYCITCGSKDGPGLGCGNCRQTGYDQTPCQLCPAGEATEEKETAT
jgi:hypothetical protein